MSLNITNLVFEGGGVKGIAYAGALTVLEQQHMLNKIEKVAGTSAGAITATLVSLKIPAATIFGIIKNLDYKSFEDGWWPPRLATEYGLYKGDVFLEWLQKMITGSGRNGGIGGLDATSTFAGFYNAGCRDLHIIATNMNTQDYQHFSYETTPDVVVAEAVRASMSIPLFFKAWKFTTHDPATDNNIYVDGGVVLNYPLDIFDTGTPNMQTLGFFLSDVNNAAHDNKLGYDDPLYYAKILYETILDAQEIDFSADPVSESRTVIINDFGIAATDFNITPQQIEALYNSGVQATKEYISNH